MIRSAIGKAMSVGRFASAVFGLALVLGLVFGVATMALGANGANFILGQLNNTATALTKLTANAQGPAMQVQNTNPGTDDTALALSVQPGEAPMRVNSATRVANLNSDKLDGKDSTEFLGVDAKAKDASNADFATFAGEAQNAQGAVQSEKAVRANDANLLDGKDSTAFFSGRTYRVQGSFAEGEGDGSGVLATASCFEGDRAMGGGGEAPIEDDLVESDPGVREWTVRYQDNPPASNVVAYVQCADFPPLR